MLPVLSLLYLLLTTNIYGCSDDQRVQFFTPRYRWPVIREFTGGESVFIGQHLATMPNRDELVHSDEWSFCDDCYKTDSKTSLFNYAVEYDFSPDSLLSVVSFSFEKSEPQVEDAIRADSVARVVFRLCKQYYGSNYRIYDIYAYSPDKIATEPTSDYVNIVWDLGDSGLVVLSYPPAKDYVDSATHKVKTRFIETEVSFVSFNRADRAWRLSRRRTAESLGLE